MRIRNALLCTALAGALLPACGCVQGAGSTPSSQLPDKIDMTKWHYQQDADVYWQVGIPYCANPADESYETMGVFVPGAYFTASDNGDGTYACEVSAEGTAGAYTAATAPIVVSVETPGYTAMAAPTKYASSTSAYTDAGFVYVYPGCRGRDAGAPAGVTDLKAAIRYVRYNEGLLPGSQERIFSFGMSGGGGQSALLGASGDSDLYAPYLESIGAVMDASDAVAGSMCWCPITSLDYADEAYEWNLGVTRTGLDQQDQQLSDALAEQFALYINELGLTDADGTALTLAASDEGIYQAGPYYDYLKGVIEGSLNNFLADTAFPYTVASGKGGFGGMAAGGLPDGVILDGELPEGELPELPDGAAAGKGGMGKGADGGAGRAAGRVPDGAIDGELPERGAGAAGAPDATDITALDDIERNDTSGNVTLTGTYETVQDYIDALNADVQWVAYDPATNTATITSIADFVQALKPASKNLGAFDQLDAGQGENVLFGYGDGEGAHFDAVLASLLEGTEYEAAFAEDLARTDALGSTVEERLNMYNPLYYLLPYYAGYDTSEVAPFWRIRSGINQSDTALATEVNLALALEALGEDVDFETVWGQAHVEAERTGDSTANFIAWVQQCCA